MFIRWLDRCILAHDTPESQALFGIVQGGLDLGLRERALALFKKRGCHGTAIGGLSGGERKSDFWQVVCLVRNAFASLQLQKLHRLAVHLRFLVLPLHAAD